jgi:hypothetical protein
VKELPPGSDGIDAVYVANKPSIIVEILNDDDSPITEPGISGANCDHGLDKKATACYSLFNG